MKEGQQVKIFAGRHKGKKGVIAQILLPENNHGEKLILVKIESEVYFVHREHVQVLD